MAGSVPGFLCFHKSALITALPAKRCGGRAGERGPCPELRGCRNKGCSEQRLKQAQSCLLSGLSLGVCCAAPWQKLPVSHRHLIALC